MANGKRYSKLRSAFIKEQDYLKTNDGCDIRFRDHVTIGSKHKLEPGQKPVYGEGNFIFTDSRFVDYRYKRIYYNSVEVLTSNKVDVDSLDMYDDMFDMVDDDLSNYVYFGSAQELIRTTIEKIIREFPSCLQSSETLLDGYYDDNNKFIEYEESKEYVVDNQFGVDLLSNDFSGTDNINRILRSELANYTINGEDITKYVLYNYYDEHKNDFKSYLDFLCLWEGRKAIDIEINDKFKLNLYVKDKELILTSPEKDLYIKPKKEKIDSYFDNLNFIERKLLNRNTYPLYTSKFTLRKGGRTYTTYHVFPTINDYCIDVSSGAFGEYISKLVEICEEYDNLYSNVINNRLTHEAIKTLDWSKFHTSNTHDDEYEIGSKRIESILNIIGRGFDDLKNSIDSINSSYPKLTTVVNNTEEIAEQNRMFGWELYNICGEDVAFEVNKNKWFKRYQNQKLEGVMLNNEFLKRLNIFSNEILSRKGTTEAIDIIFSLFGFGRGDYDIKEECYLIDNIHDIETYTNIFEAFSEEVIGQVPSDITYGLPYNVVEEYDEKYIVPYLDTNKMLYNDIYFQSKGGWLKYSNDVENTFDYTETRSYLRMVNYIEDLTLINVNDVEYGDLIYVSNIENFKGYYPDFELSHYFTLVNAYNSNVLSSWRPIEKGYSLYDKVKYVETIIDKNFGNNPHIGYGRYDLGNTYIEALQNPFLYYANTNASIDMDIVEKSDALTSDVETIQRDKKIFSRKSIQPFNERVPYNEGEYFYMMEGAKKRYYVSKVDEKTYGTFDERKDNFMSVLADDQYYEISDYSILNSKKVILYNKIDNDLYKDYFKKVILKYIEQVIPSTTILVLHGY